MPGSSGRTEGGQARAGHDDDEPRFGMGDIILGVYVIERQLGRGGMGTVYLGRDDVSGQRVAIKVLPGTLAREKDIRDRFIQEARALAALDHPGIVPLITFAQEDDDRFLVMKYVGGRPLEAVITAETVIEPDDARRILREVAAALGYAHGKGVVHRDIKPANILIDEAGRVVVVDFGIARKLEGEKRLTQTGMLMGTPQYMSPEQIEGRVVDGRADLYACGLLLFEMLAGRPPFDGEKTFDILKAHVERPVPDVRLAREGRSPGSTPVPDDLVALCHALLEKDPAHRPADSAAVIDALDGSTSFALPPPTETEDIPALSPAPAGPARRIRTTSETPALAFSDSRPDGDDDGVDDDFAPSNPARRWAAGLLLASALAVGGFVVFGDRLPIFSGDDDVAVVRDPFAMAALLARARVAYDNGKLDDARIAVETALNLDDDDADALLLRSRILLASDKPIDARASLARLPAALTEEQRRQRAEIEVLLSAPRKPLVDERARGGKATKPKPKPKPLTTTPTTTTPAPEPPPSSRPRPLELDDDALGRVTHATRDRFSRCYVEHVLANDPTGEGEVTLMVTIAPGGAVTDAVMKKNPFGQAGLAPCVLEAAKQWRFPAFDGDEELLLHSLYFRPG